ncbi:DNA polymerase III subunit epsilon [Ectothiorhodospira shaposhnikovii]|uniref:DNA polymerase III subunit epsilon n=1 Tax=Ectothiorhodospira shaposhnikovii TaxID=1054 RepID=UPI001EE86CD0|nr:DNA polymerase III subunit epsilon [Ectothiorhodospira shaposhnikovii]
MTLQANDRIVILDTETTGLEPSDGHRIIEIGCVEMVRRRHTSRHYHQYLQPDREVDAGAVEVHGITNEFLADKPRFADVVEDFIEFVRGSELIIHNAPFDVGFINHELSRLDGDWGRLEDYCTITDSLAMARKMHPGQRNSLDALCKRYQIDNSGRELHGALLDARILAEVYLAMTGGQKSLSLGMESEGQGGASADTRIRRLPVDRPPLAVIRPTEAEQEAHEAYLKVLAKAGEIQAW